MYESSDKQGIYISGLVGEQDIEKSVALIWGAIVPAALLLADGSFWAGVVKPASRADCASNAGTTSAAYPAPNVPNAAGLASIEDLQRRKAWKQVGALAKE